MPLSEYAFSMQMRDTIKKMVKEEIDRERPRYRYGTVESIDKIAMKVSVVLNGETSSIRVNMGAIQPTSPGQVVRVEGIGTDKYISDIIGVPGIMGGAPAGTISLYAGDTPPDNWLICDGAAVSRTTYASLFSIIGTKYGSGNGTTTFNLPNLKGRTPVGKDAAQTEFDNLGETGGSKTHTLTIGQVPNVQGRMAIHGGENGSNLWQPTGAFSTSTTTTQYKPPPASIAGSSSISTAVLFNNGGGGGSHPILQPYQVVNFIIKVSMSDTAGDTEIAQRVSALESTHEGHEALTLRDRMHRVQRVLSGGNPRKVSSTGVSWSQRFIIMGAGWQDDNLNGYWNVDMPPDGTVIPVYGSSTVSSITVAGGEVPMSTWYGLYYDVPLTTDHISNPAQFKLVSYTEKIDTPIPPTWILICVRNSDSNGPRWMWGDGLRQDYWRTFTLGNSWVDFAGGYSDHAYRFTHEGKVELRGLVKNGTFSSSVAAGIFGATLAPEGQEIFIASSSTGHVRIDVKSNGDLLIYAAYNTGSNAWVSLANVSWWPAGS